LKQALKSRLAPLFPCRKLDTSQVTQVTSLRTFEKWNERRNIERWKMTFYSIWGSRGFLTFKIVAPRKQKTFTFFTLSF
jgi:hypothetical protein